MSYGVHNQGKVLEIENWKEANRPTRVQGGYVYTGCPL